MRVLSFATTPEDLALLPNQAVAMASAAIVGSFDARFDEFVREAIGMKNDAGP